MGRNTALAAFASIALVVAPLPAPAVEAELPETELRPSRQVELETLTKPARVMLVDGQIALLDASATAGRLVRIDGSAISDSVDPATLGIHGDSGFSWILDSLGRPSAVDVDGAIVEASSPIAGPATIDPNSGDLVYLDSTDGWLKSAAPDAGRLRIRRVARFGGGPLTALAIEAETGNLMLLEGTHLLETNPQGRVIGRYRTDVDVDEAAGAVVAASLDPTDDPSTTSFFVLTSEGALIEMPLVGPVSVNATTVAAALVAVTDTSLYVPPSPDPSGIAYSTASGTLAISDGEVNEIPALFTGDNVFLTDRSGSLLGTASTMAFSNEPTGIAFNPANGNVYISDDTGTRGVYHVELGPDGLLGTGDDTVWTHDAGAYGSTDPEGVAYDSARGHVIMVDGVGEEVYDIDPGPNGVLDGVAPAGDDTVTSFDVTVLGINDPEGVEYNPDNQSLYVLGHNDLIAETTIAGSLIRYIDLSSIGMMTPAGLAYAPGSLAAGERHLYLVDRGVDNNNDPNENDGRMFEVSFGATSGFNLPPTVDAGADLAIAISDAATLDGTVTDDGLPDPPGSTSVAWTKVSGLGTVTFADPNAVDTSATFSAAGAYTLRLSATDGSLGAFDEVVVTVTGPGGESGFESTVSTSTDDAEEDQSGPVDLNSSDLELTFAGGSQTVGMRFDAIPIPNGATILSATVQFTVDETPSDPTNLLIQGEAADAAATFTSLAFSISSRPRTAAQVSWSPPPWPTVGEAGPAQQTPDLSPILQEIVSRPGWAAGNPLVLVITGTGERVAESFDGDPTAAPRLSVLYSTTTPPTVDAGPDQTIEIGNPVTLDATVTDDGLPNPPGAVTTTWTQVSGPGTTTFNDPAAVDTTATFSTPGTYVLRLTADDGESTGADEVTVIVTAANQAPTVDAGIDQSVGVPSGSPLTAALDATVTDDGLPNPPGAVTTTWTQVSGPGSTTFADAGAVDTTATFSTPGSYVLRLAADDSELSSFDEVVIDVSIQNTAPAVDAGSDQTVLFGDGATLDATVTDDGLPNPPGAVTTTWAQVSGPGSAGFADAGAVDTTVAFSAPGTYVLRLTADDSDLSSFDELTVTVSPGNQAPLVDAGIDQSVGVPSGSPLTATLDATVTDDGLPSPPGAVTTTWTQVSGPGTTTFNDPAAVDTTATFSTPGSYTLRLAADDSELSAFDEVTIDVSIQNTAPTVDAGPDQTVGIGDLVTLDATVTDDGLPSPPGAVTTTWTQVSGPGTTTFNDPAAVDTTATFSTPGSYTLRLAADDSELSSFDEVTIAVTPPNQAPFVDAGPDQSAAVGAPTTLSGSVSDDGLPSPPGAVTTTWTKVSGPGAVAFGNPVSLSTTATFDAIGTYIIRLTADDGALTASDDVAVTVTNAPTVAEARVSAGSDDAEERSNGAATLTSSDLELVHDRGGEQTVGMRFTGLQIPQGAVITSAWLRFTTDEATAVATDLTIQAEDTDSAAPFTTAAFGISSRPRTAASVSWSPAPWNTVGESAGPQTTPDLTAVVDEVVSRPGWSTTSALSVIVTGVGERVADSFEGGAAVAPLIHIEYVIATQQRPAVDAGPDQTVAVSDTASLDGMVTDDGLPDPPAAVTVSWAKVSGPGTVTFGDPNAVNTTATFSDPGSYTLSLTASDGQLSSSDDVHVTVTNPSGTLSLEIRVSSNSDDGEESAAGQTNINSSDLELVFDKSDQTVGIRFNGVTIPRGATIVDAWVQFTADETGSGPTTLVFRAEASDNAATFSNTSLNISSRPTTSASTTWMPGAWTTVGQAGPDQRAGGLASLVQEVVARGGWSNGNSLVIIITGTGERVAEAHNGVPSSAPLLHIDYLP